MNFVDRFCRVELACCTVFYDMAWGGCWSLHTWQDLSISLSLAFGTDRLVDKLWDGIEIGEIGASRIPESGQDPHRRIEVAVTFAWVPQKLSWNCQPPVRQPSHGWHALLQHGVKWQADACRTPHLRYTHALPPSQQCISSYVLPSCPIQPPSWWELQTVQSKIAKKLL